MGRYLLEGKSAGPEASMSVQGNQEYFEMRAAQERRMAEDAEDARIAALHLDLAARYDALTGTRSKPDTIATLSTDTPSPSRPVWNHWLLNERPDTERRYGRSNLLALLDGRLLDKKVAVEEAAAGPGPFLTNEPDYVHVRFFGDTAVAQGSETWTKKGGRRGKFVWTDTWVKRGGCWQIVHAQDTVVPLPAQ
jgi:hypothetical protein